MTPQDQPVFEQMLGAGALLYGVRLDRVQFQLWWKLCGHLPMAAFMRAFEQALAERNKWPVPADILRAARSGGGRPDSGPPRLKAPSNREHARESFALIREIVRTRMPPAARLQRFVAMARAWPGKGWEEAVMQTERLVAKTQATA